MEMCDVEYSSTPLLLYAMIFFADTLIRNMSYSLPDVFTVCELVVEQYISDAVVEMGIWHKVVPQQ